jgi:hypothetical protein
VRLRAALAVVAAAALLALGCVDTVDEPDDPYQPQEVPFAAQEAYEYVLLDDDGDEQGSGVMAVLAGNDNDTLALVQSFADGDGNADESVLVVDAGTLRPRRGSRDILDADDDRRALVESEYAELNDDGDYGVRIRQSRFDPMGDDDPDVRCSPLRAPRSSFDNDSSLFLWRTIPFDAGHEVQYTNVLTNRREKRIMTVRVRRREEVETPAGTFDSWLVTIETDEGSQEAWFATTPEHRLLKYDNDAFVFLYRGEAQGAPPAVDAPDGVPAECR